MSNEYNDYVNEKICKLKEVLIEKFPNEIVEIEKTVDFYKDNRDKIKIGSFALSSRKIGVITKYIKQKSNGEKFNTVAYNFFTWNKKYIESQV